MGFLAYSNKSKMKLTFYVYGLVIFGGNNFLHDFHNHEIDTFSFGSKVTSILRKVVIILKL
jgi:hypothetical protein